MDDWRLVCDLQKWRHYSKDDLKCLEHDKFRAIFLFSKIAELYSWKQLSVSCRWLLQVSKCIWKYSDLLLDRRSQNNLHTFVRLCGDDISILPVNITYKFPNTLLICTYFKIKAMTGNQFAVLLPFLVSLRTYIYVAHIYTK